MMCEWCKGDGETIRARGMMGWTIHRTCAAEVLQWEREHLAESEETA